MRSSKHTRTARKKIDRPLCFVVFLSQLVVDIRKQEYRRLCRHCARAISGAAGGVSVFQGYSRQDKQQYSVPKRSL